MNPIRISINLAKIEGARVLAVKDTNGKPVYYIGVPVDQCFVPTGTQGQIHLITVMYETPASQYSDFAIKQSVSQDLYQNMSQEQRNAMPFIGKGTWLKQNVDRQVAQFAAAAEVTTEYADFMHDSTSTNQPLPSKPPY